jgi:broad specificity phosphatase PhoE
MAAPRAYFVRHGQTDWNAQARLQGQADTDINATGRAQAARNGALLAGLIGTAQDWDFVASPLRRTRETMEIIRREMGLDPAGYTVDRRLIELHFGAWQGFTYAELEAARPGSTAGRTADKWNFRPPGADAETYAMLAARVGPWLAAIDRPTVCVTHGGVIRAIFSLAGGLEPDRAAALDVPQDRVLSVDANGLAWV